MTYYNAQGSGHHRLLKASNKNKTVQTPKTYKKLAKKMLGTQPLNIPNTSRDADNKKVSLDLNQLHTDSRGDAPIYYPE